MTETDYLLLSLIEELAEIQQAICKMMRFGPGDRYPTGDQPTTLEKVQGEIIDSTAIMELLEAKGLTIRCTDAGQIELGIAAKKMKVDKYMKYAKTRGTLFEYQSDKAKRLEQAATDFVQNLMRGNVAGSGEFHAATDASFRELKKAVELPCSTSGAGTPATGANTSVPNSEA